MMAPDALASRTSLSVMAPTPRCTTSTRTSRRAELRQRVGERFGRAALVGLDDDRQGGDLPFLERPAEVLERAAPLAATVLRLALEPLRASGRCRAPPPRRPPPGTSRRPPARRRSRGSAPGSTGPAAFTVLAALVEQRAHAAGELAADEVVADLQRAALHQHAWRADPCPDRAWPRRTVPWRPAVGVGLEVEDVGLQQDLLEQAVDAGALLGRDRGRERRCRRTPRARRCAAGGPA